MTRRVRPLAAAECAAVAAVLAGMEPWATLGYGAAGLARYLGCDDPGLRRLAVDRSGVLAGVLALRAPWLRGPYIELLAVLPEAQGDGVGRTLLDWAAAEAQDTGNLWACVSAFNAPARAFYARAGFAEVAPLPDLVRPEFEEILLRKRV